MAKSVPTLRSRVTVAGLDRTPHRAFLRAMGHDDAALARPFVVADLVWLGPMVAFP